MVKKEEKGEIVLYQPEGEVRLEVRVENETVWLTQAQMAVLFNTDRTSITKHIRNIYQTGELEEISTCAKRRCKFLSVKSKEPEILRFWAL